MITITTHHPVDNMVQSMREIRDEISNEIKDMTFAEERAYLDKILKNENLGNNTSTQDNKKSPSIK